jgi:Metallopeptidase toxin 3
MKFNQFDKEDAGPTASSAVHAKAFPLCGRYLRIWLTPAGLANLKTFDASGARTSTSRWTTFVKYCGSEEVARSACTWDFGPLVEINSRETGRANGHYKGGDVVFIHGKVANAYEQGTGWLVWEATVLHELVHWARAKNRLQDPMEMGKEFEKETYGADVSLQTPWRAGP